MKSLPNSQSCLVAELWLKQKCVTSRPVSNSLSSMNSNEIIKNEIISRIRQQTKCELSFHFHVKDAPSKQIPRNCQCTLIPRKDVITAGQGCGVLWSCGDFLPTGNIYAARWEAVYRSQRFYRRAVWTKCQSSSQLRDTVLIPSSASEASVTHMTYMAFCSWNAFMLFLFTHS